MSYFKFKACNHGCRAAKSKGMNTNGMCRFPILNKLADDAILLSSYHDDAEVRKFARKVEDLLNHIVEDE